jgi:L-lactate dehydrogenase complex protein LldE
MAPRGTPRVGLFVTCLVDLFRPTVGFAAVKLLEDAGCTVEVPAAQTCCGQPAYNSGDRDDARRIAREVIAAFRGFDFVVAPSGSCGGTIKVHYPRLLAGTPDEEAARELAGRTHELVSFLHDVLGVRDVKEGVRYEGVVTYHDGCSGLRELGVHDQPRALLARLPGATLRDLPEAEVCCGFGGTFCIKYPEISTKMVSDKARHVVETGADTLAAGELGCLMNIAGRLMREGARVRARHVAELLAGMTDGPAIGERPRR